MPNPGPSYDSLFAATIDPTVIIDARSASIVSANAAAAQLLGLSRNALVGVPFPKMLDHRDDALMRAALVMTRADGVARLDAIRFRGNSVHLNAKLSLVRCGGVSYVLVHFYECYRTGQSHEDGMYVTEYGQSRLCDALDGGSAALVVTDSELDLLYANGAFLRLMETDSLTAVPGPSLTRWLEFSPADLVRMQAQMAAREMVTTVSVRRAASRPGQPELQALAIAVPDGSHSIWGFAITERSRLN